jgi:hypothetical protein
MLTGEATPVAKLKGDSLSGGTMCINGFCEVRCRFYFSLSCSRLLMRPAQSIRFYRPTKLSLYSFVFILGGSDSVAV